MRIKSGIIHAKKRKKLQHLTKGYYGGLHKLYRSMKGAVMRSGKHAFKGRKLKKRDYRAMWIIRINGALTGLGINYNRFINALKKANVQLNRKVISELAVRDQKAFQKVVDIAKAVK